MQKETCIKCNEDFNYWVVEDFGVGTKEKEKIKCPYCGKENGFIMTTGLVRSFKKDQ